MSLAPPDKQRTRFRRPLGVAVMRRILMAIRAASRVPQYRVPSGAFS
jgi:hypothetical protein